MPDSFTCSRCGRTSHHPVDVDEGYCGACHDWTGTRSPSDWHPTTTTTTTKETDR